MVAGELRILSGETYDVGDLELLSGGSHGDGMSDERL